MSGKRVLALYGALLFCFAAVVCRLYWLCSDTAYGARAAAQSVVTLHLPARRGNFYDHRAAGQQETPSAETSRSTSSKNGDAAFRFW